MVTQSVRLPDDLAQRLAQLSAVTKRPKSSFLVEALERYLDEIEDLEIALSRVRDPGSEWVDHAEVKRDLGID
ncbi:MAG: ribbon-helix-helix domain-containing protein [Thermoanaerobaculales bacterium]|nr:ribbon-helix-helix domain-containing protein [Thermoanaerobaculales bacterium]